MSEDSSSDVTIPDQITDIMRETEIENMRSRRGWATGTLVCIGEDGDETQTIEDAWIEMLNGDGEAANMGGVRFMGVADGEYKEAYAYPERDIAEEYTTPPYWFVDEYNEDDVDYGVVAPK